MPQPLDTEACTICGGALMHYASYQGKWNVLKCRECGFGKSNVTSADIESFYESDYFGGKTAKFSQDHEEQIDSGKKWWVDTFVSGNDINCLEVGPGSAAMIPKYMMKTRSGFKYEAVEISHIASRHLTDCDLSVHTGRIYDTEISDVVRGRFDYVIATEVIEHDLDPARFATGLYNSLRAGGRACLTTGNFDGMTARIKGSAWYYIDPPAHVCFYTPRSATRLFKKAGFRNVRIHCVGLNYVRLRQKYPIPGFLQLVHALQIPTGMTICAQK